MNELTDIIPMEQNSPHGEAFEEISGEEEWIVRMERALRLCLGGAGVQRREQLRHVG